MNWVKSLGMERLASLLASYLQVRGRLLALGLLRYLVVLVGFFISLLALVLCLSYALFFISLAVAVVLNDAIGGAAIWGYVIVASGYVLLGLLVFFILRSRRVQTKIINMLYARLQFSGGKTVQKPPRQEDHQEDQEETKNTSSARTEDT